MIALLTLPWSTKPFALSLIGFVGKGLSPILATADCLNGSTGERKLSSFNLPSFEKTKENDKIKIVQKFFILIKIYPYKEVYFPWR